MKIGTLNLQYGKGADGRRPSAQLLIDTAQALGEHELDALALQEVDHRHPRSGFVDQAAILADALGMNHHRVRTACGTGLAVFSPHPIESAHDFTLPKVTSALRKTSSNVLGGWRIKPEQQRKVAYTRIWVNESTPLIFASCHFEARAQTSRKQLALALGGFHRVRASVGAGSDPLILAGDFNMSSFMVNDVVENFVHEPGGDATGVVPEFSALAAERTFPAKDPTLQIDHIVASGLITHRTWTQRFPISDHLGLMADVDMRAYRADE